MPTINLLPRKPKKEYPKNDRNKAVFDLVYNTTAWRKLRGQYLKAHPLCELCLSEGKTSPAVEVHHVHPIGDAESLDGMVARGFCWENLQSLCVWHHHLVHQKIHDK